MLELEELRQPQCSQSKVSVAKAVPEAGYRGLLGQTEARSYCTTCWPCLSPCRYLCDLDSGSSSATWVFAVADEAIDSTIDSMYSYLHCPIAAAVAADWLPVPDGRRWCLDFPSKCHNPDNGCGSACRVSSTSRNAMIPSLPLP